MRLNYVPIWYWVVMMIGFCLVEMNYKKLVIIGLHLASFLNVDPGQCRPVVIGVPARLIMMMPMRILLVQMVAVAAHLLMGKAAGIELGQFDTFKNCYLISSIKNKIKELFKL